MSLCFGIKILCDLSVYFIYAQLICEWLGTPVDARGALVLLALAGGLSCFLRGRGRVRFAPLVLVPVCLFLMPGWVGALVLLAPAAYLAVTAARRLYRVRSTAKPATAFAAAACCCCRFWSCLCSALASWWPGLLPMPMAVVYLSCSVLLLRMLRHEPATLSQPRFIILNSSVLVLALAAAAAVSSPAVLSAVGSGASWLYQHLVMPPLMLLGYVAAGFMWVAMHVIQWFSGGSVQNSENEMPQLDIQENPLFEEVELAETPEFLQALFTTLFIVVCALAAWWFFRRLLGYRAREAGEPAVAEVRGQAAASPRGERPPGCAPAIRAAQCGGLPAVSDPVQPHRHRYAALCHVRDGGRAGPPEPSGRAH